MPKKTLEDFGMSSVVTLSDEGSVSIENSDSDSDFGVSVRKKKKISDSDSDYELPVAKKKKTNANNGVAEKSKKIAAEKPAKSVVEKPAKSVVEKPAKSVVEKPQKSVKQPSKKKEAATASENGSHGDAPNGDVPHLDPLNVFEDIETATQHGKKRLSIEQIYQKKSQLEHILLRPDTYIGSVELLEQQMWVYNGESDKIVSKNISFVPGLYKIFDEIIVNAADNKQRDKKMSCIKVKIDQTKNEISIWNNGRGIPVVEHKLEKMYVPELIFGTLLTSSNYDDSQRKVTGGRNGYGAKLCNIFSKKFTVETSSREYKKSFKQTWTSNMSKTEPAKIGPAAEEDFTCITFTPDLAKFGMDHLDDDIVALMSRRAFDMAGTGKGVKVYLNGKKVPVMGFKEYVEQYTKDKFDDNNLPLKMVFDQCGERWEVAVTVSDRGFQQVGFVNSIATTKGGRHVDHVADQIVDKMIEHVRKQLKKSGMAIKPFQIKNHMWIFVNCLIENPTFDSQTKENMTLQAKSFGSKCVMTEKFLAQTMKCGIVDSVMQWVQFKAQAALDKKCHATKHSKLKGLPKLEDANDAGTKKSSQCTLILTEGDSAKTLAVAGLGVVGRDHFGVFPLRGKVLNVREASHKQIMENAEINAMIKILGLQYKKKYSTPDDLQTLRYGKIMIMTDQDQDGSHIKGLIVNFIHYNWPSLIRQNFIEEFITPIVKVSKGHNNEISFFSLPEYEEWKKNTDNWHTWKVKYYKGLGTSTSNEAREYFTDMARHRVRFRYGGEADDTAVELAFSRQKVEDRKTWLTGFMNDRKMRRENNLPDIYLYRKDTTHVSYRDFVDKELVLFSNMDNERSIPSLVDGLKPGQRKVLFTCLKRNDKREVKVAQLAGSVAEMSAYHHGEVSLMSTIVNLAQNFVGSNNVNFLLPIGQFGSRLLGGKDSASPRYIFTMMSPVTRALFHQDDDPILWYLTDDSKKIEPSWYCPIIPTVLLNGPEGIGTGWSSKVPNFNPRDLVENVKRLIRGEELVTMRPWFRNFKGEIIELGQHRFLTNGEIYVDEIGGNGREMYRLEITELPIGTWTQTYKENVLEPMLQGTEKVAPKISDFKEFHTDTLVKFVVEVTQKQYDALQAEGGLHKAFKLQSTVSTSNMILFDADGCLKRYESVNDILREFYTVRMQMYVNRKKYLLGFLEAEVCRLSNLARFVVEKIDNLIKLENINVKTIVQQLVTRKYDPDPIKKWKDDQKKGSSADEADESEGGSPDEDAAPGATSAEVTALLADYHYLLSIQAIKFSMEHKDELLKQRDKKQGELSKLRGKEVKEFWTEDLEVFLEELGKQWEKEKDEAANAGKGKKGAKGQPLQAGKQQRKPGGNDSFAQKTQGIRVEPIIDASVKEKLEKFDLAKENKVKGIAPAKKGRKPKVVDKDGDNNNNGSKKITDFATKQKKKLESEDDDDSVKIESDDDDLFNDSSIFRSDKVKAILSDKE